MMFCLHVYAIVMQSSFFKPTVLNNKNHGLQADACKP